MAKLKTIKYPAKLPFKYPITPVHNIFNNATKIYTFLNPILSINNAHPALEQPLATASIDPTTVNYSSFNPI